MPKAKITITLDARLLALLDNLVSERHVRSRSQAVEAALAEKLGRPDRTRLATECSKLDPAREQRLAEGGE
ncbi:MAG: ribbon-helix-helix protein, CopG family [Acidobacteria bacterium]|nr:ribbon-helix-helix protein, CopG family [Acidobacteriota bacterium]